MNRNRMLLIGLTAIVLCFGTVSCAKEEVNPGNWEKFFPTEVEIDENLIDEAPIDKAANASVVKLYRFLRNNFGKKMILGDANLSIGGATPMITGYDLMFYTEGCVLSGTKIEDGVPYRIKWLQDHPWRGQNPGGVLTLHWHWYAPKDGYSFYAKSGAHPDGTSFDVRRAVQEGTEENKLILRDIDAIAVQLKKISDAGFPVLFRPLHEAGGNDGKNAWFWWGAKGAEPCLKLWDILYDRLVNYHRIHNLIWVWSSPVEGWYPGNDKVDILGYDSYPEKFDYSAQEKYFNKLYKLCGGTKMLAMTENGPIPDINLCFAKKAPWLYFLTWYGFHDTHNSKEHIDAVLSDSRLIKLK